MRLLLSFSLQNKSSKLFWGALFFSLICWIATILHFSGQLYGNPLTWITWLLSLIFILLAFSPSFSIIKNNLKKFEPKTFLFFLTLVFIFIWTHLWNFQTAPWNYNGLFDDAAWDIYFAKTYIFTHQPFQAAFFNGGISREVIFHYYITFFFKLLGYNLLTFVFSLLILGLTTFLFTCLFIHQLFRNYWVTLISALIINFLPLHYIHTFVGHRYAMAAPLMVSSLYFLYTGFKNKSLFNVVLSAILAALCMDSAIMGKQFLLGLLGTGILFLIFHRKFFTRIIQNYILLFIIALIVAMTPLIIYIMFNPIYFVHERDLTRDFFSAFANTGLDGWKPYWKQMQDVFFGNSTYYRWFLPDFPVIPYAYYLFLIPGLYISIIKKHYEVILLSLIPVCGAFISGCSDYRVLHAAPFWTIAVAFFWNEVLKQEPYRNLIQRKWQSILIAVSSIFLIIGLFSSIQYINLKSKDPNSIWLLPQRDVAATRFLRDIVAEIPSPSTDLRNQEFNKLSEFPEPKCDTLICQYLGYAITHLFLKDYNDKKVMSLSDQLPFNLLTESQILSVNKKAIEHYIKNTKDLRLVWEEHEKTRRIIQEFKKLAYLGNSQILTSEHAGQRFSFYVLTIKNSQIDMFKQKTKLLHIQ